MPFSSDTAPQYNKLEISGAIIERTAKRMRQHFQRMLKHAKVDVTFDQWLILQALNKEDGLSQLAIAQEVYKDPPTVTRIIDLLCKKKLLVRKADLSDRRKFNIFLTTKGQHKIKEIIPLTYTFRSKAWDKLTEQQMSQLTDTLNIIFNNLK